jgi:hypothetical protein
MNAPTERRRYKRFEMTSRNGGASLIWETAGRLEYERCVLRNLSYGGMCFRTFHSMRTGEDYRLSLTLRNPPLGSVSVTARIRWLRRFESDEWECGAEFVESSKSWLGPEDTQSLEPQPLS